MLVVAASQLRNPVSFVVEMVTGNRLWNTAIESVHCDVFCPKRGLTLWRQHDFNAFLSLPERVRPLFGQALSESL